MRATHSQRGGYFNVTPEQATTYITNLLKIMLARKASDLFVSCDFPPSMKIDGKMTPVAGAQRLTAVQTAAMAQAIMNEKQRAEFETEKECNFAISPAGIGRFRVNIYVQQGYVAMVLRTITSKIPNFDEMRLPVVLKDVAMTKRGLVILVGGTGSGKSTSLAAMIDYRNENSHGHIITVEDPVEYVHKNKNCLISHREVGTDTLSWSVALKNTLRQAPDVILIGEIRDRDTMEHAIAFAETGHLCMATLHANSANQALDRIINFFPEERRAQLLMDLSLNLRSVISQRLIPRSDGKGRRAAIEILLNSPTVSDLIFKGEVHGLKAAMAKGKEMGMQTFDQALFYLYEAGDISYEDALRNADSMNELKLNIKLNSKRQPASASGGAKIPLGMKEDPKPEAPETEAPAPAAAAQ